MAHKNTAREGSKATIPSGRLLRKSIPISEIDEKNYVLKGDDLLLRLMKKAMF
jgi:hypothetical protein